MSNNGFLVLPNDLVRLWLNHLDCLDLVRGLRDVVYSFDGERVLGDEIDFLMGDCNWRLGEVLHMLYCKRLLRNVLNVIDRVSIRLDPVHMLNRVGLWSDVLSLFNGHRVWND